VFTAPRLVPPFPPPAGPLAKLTSEAPEIGLSDGDPSALGSADRDREISGTNEALGCETSAGVKARLLLLSLIGIFDRPAGSPLAFVKATTGVVGGVGDRGEPVTVTWSVGAAVGNVDLTGAASAGDRGIPIHIESRSAGGDQLAIVVAVVDLADRGRRNRS